MTATRADLQELHSQMVGIFQEWMKYPSKYTLRATHLDVLRAFLRDNKCTKDLDTTMAVRASLEDLKDIDFPF